MPSERPESNDQPGQEMGHGQYVYKDLMAGFDQYRTVATADVEAATYHELAQDAEAGGDTELAKRLHGYAADMSEAAREEFYQAQLKTGWENFQELAHHDSGYATAAYGFDGGPSAEKVLAPLRRMLIGDVDLEEVGPTRTADGADVYAVPMKDRMRYVEIHEPVDPDDHRGIGRFTSIQVFKDPVPEKVPPTP